MTSKEALKGIKQAIAEHLHLKTGVSVEKHFEYLQYDTEIDIVDKDLTELEELKKRDTPKKVYSTNYHYCPNCNTHYLIEYQKFCNDCGQRLDWNK